LRIKKDCIQKSGELWELILKIRKMLLPIDIKKQLLEPWEFSEDNCTQPVVEKQTFAPLKKEKRSKKIKHKYI